MSRHDELIRVIQRLSCGRDLAGIVDVLRETARSLTGADGVTVVLRDGDLCHYAEEDAIAPLWKGRRFPMKDCISGWCMLHREQVAIADIYADPRIPHDAYRPTFVKSLAMVPIRSQDPIGAIGAYWATPHQASAEELAVLQSLSDSASVAMANVQLIESLSESSRRKDEFLAMLAHELRNPLVPLRNALHVQRLQPGDPESTARAREIMERQVQHLSRVVDDLLDVSRLERGTVGIQRERLDLGRLVRETLEDHRAGLEAGGLTLLAESPRTPVWVNGDETRLTQALGNLLDNAAKFTPSGGFVTVRLALDAARDQAVVTVRDSGVGIDQAMLPRVFEVFSQADRSLERSGGGLGLGLSVVRNLIELHGGSVEAASDGPGRGALFTLRLPRLPEPPALTVWSTASAPAAASRGSILVVEDNRDAAESLRMLLELSGYEVSVAANGREGVQAAQSLRPTIVLCDIGLPEMDGFEVARALRANPVTAAAHLIAVTGYGTEADRQRTSEAGFDAHLVKPVDPEHLIGELAMVGANDRGPGPRDERGFATRSWR